MTLSTRQRPLKTLLAIALSIAAWSPVVGAQTEPRPEEVRAAIFAIDESPREGEVARATEGGPKELTLSFDPALAAPNERESATIEELRRLSGEMRSPEYRARLATEIAIPKSIENEALLESLNDMTESERELFVGRKAKFLAFLAKAMAGFRMKPARINEFLEGVNEELFKGEKPRGIAQGNAIVVTPGLSASTGFGLNDFILGKIRAIPGFGGLPERSGFFVLLQPGVSFSLSNKKGVDRFDLVPTLDFRWATRIHFPFAIAAAGLAATITVEDAPNLKVLQISKFKKLSILTWFESAGQIGTVLQGNFITLIPGGGLTAAMEGKNYRLRLPLMRAAYEAGLKFTKWTTTACKLSLDASHKLPPYPPLF